jgi:16S rRNA (uracil1498-N3)-methyltransferase
MTRRRWIADEVHADRAVLLGQNAQHLVRVLRAQVGQEFDVAADGQVRVGTIVSISDERVEFELSETVAAEPPLDLTLLVSIFKFDRMEWAIEKAAELGVAKIIPIIARRTDAHLAKAADKRAERWRRIAKEAAQQSRRLDVPEIVDPAKLAQAIQKIIGTRILLAETEQEKTLKSQLQNVSQPVTLAFGPEGGWTEDEVRQFEAAGWNTATLGSTILRAETAIIAAVSIAVSELSSTT